MNLNVLETPAIIKSVASQNISMEAFTAGYTQKQCLKRLGTSQEMANLVVFLASDLCPFITGANLTVDGGYTAI
jgi:NAD(P)-dependent dehydrogenase (short-subunit alcohol dehydrogenase family)